LGERGPLGGQIQVIGRHQMGIQPVGVQGRPPSVRTLGGVLDQDVGVAVGVASAAHAVLERHRHQPTNCLVAIRAVVVTPDPEAMALQVGDGCLEGFGASFGQQPPHLVAATGGQQRHALGGAEAVVEGLHPLVDPLTPVLPGPLEPLPVQLAWVGVQHLAAESLDCLDLDSSRASQPTRRLDRPHVALERLGPDKRLQLLDPLVGGAGLEGLQ